MVNNIIENIAARNDTLIGNDYYILNNKIKDKFHIVIHYNNNKKIQIIVRRLDSESGWEFDLKIKLYDKNNDSSQVISIGSSEENYKIIELYTKITIIRKEQKNIKIPKVIMQTNNVLIKNTKHYNSICSILEFNPEYEYIFFDDKRCRKFLCDNFKMNILLPYNENDDIDVVKAFDYIIPGAIKADFFRYCYLYIKGGIYLDHKIICNISFDDIIDENDEFVLCKDDAPNSYYNGIIMCTKNNPQIYELIKACMKNIFENQYLNDIHEPTGNKLFYKYFNHFNTKLKKNNENISFNNNNNEILFISNYQNYYQENYKNFRSEWTNKNFYYKNIIKTDAYYFYFGYSKFNDKFNIIQLKDGIFVIKRIDSNLGWTQDVKVDSIHIQSGIKKMISIGISNENEKIFVIE